MRDVTIPEKKEVAVYNSNNDVWLMTTKVLSLGAGKLLIKTAAVGLCGGEMMEWYLKAGAPKVLGHELKGTVVALEGQLITQKHFCRLGEKRLQLKIQKTSK